MPNPETGLTQNLCPEYGNNAANGLNSHSKFLPIHTSVHPQLWPFNPHLGHPFSQSPLWASSSSNTKCKCILGFCPGTFLPSVLTPPGSSHPPWGFSDHRCTEDFRTCLRTRHFLNFRIIFNCLLDISTWKSHRKFKINVSKTSLISSFNLLFLL